MQEYLSSVFLNELENIKAVTLLINFQRTKSIKALSPTHWETISKNISFPK